MSYATVRLINGYPRQLTYRIPEAYKADVLLHKIVLVPLQRRTEHALVCAVVDELTEKPSFAIRDIASIEAVPQDPHYHNFIMQLSSYYAIDPLILYRRMRTNLTKQEDQEAFAASSIAEQHYVQLTHEQQEVVEQLRPTIINPRFDPTVLAGVTGSGKTEIYKALIRTAYSSKKTTLLLLPEVSLAVNFTKLLEAQLPDIPVYGFHSATTAVDKRMLWQQLVVGTPLVLVGVHMPLLLPIAALGLIIVDEEHEVGFQEKKHPRINTKEAALMRAQITGIPIVLGSATPSVGSLFNCKRRNWRLCRLTHRFSGSFPQVQVIKITKSEKRKEFWISRELEQAIVQRLARQEQVILFLNRRGFSFFVQCAQCSFIFSCKFCSVTLTYHQSDNAEKVEILSCHYCSYTQKLPQSCSQCAAPEKEFLKKGLGTQQLAALVQRLFPQARVVRADADSTRNKKKWQRMCEDIVERKVDIIIGTQTITKGYHFPGVTLVGVIWAELQLSMPFYNASEVALQQLIQVAGRAGRASHDGLVMIQTFSEHEIFNYVDERNYMQFYEYEIAYRQELSYPPCIRFAEFELRHADQQTVMQDAQQCAQFLRAHARKQDWHVTVLGPAQPPVHKLQNIYLYRIYVKSSNIQHVIALYHAVRAQKRLSTLLFTPNPLS